MSTRTAALAAHIRTDVSRVVIGQAAAIDDILRALLCGGHVLLEGPPGVGKTLMVKVVARLLALRFQRVQCTADLMPADIIGANVFSQATGGFSLHRGPIFTDLLLVDEVNRTPPRTQAALLEAMEERQVTIDGVRHPLSDGFTTFATQNPIEFEGVYPLPEAQLDRFLVKVMVAYPDANAESAMLAAHHEGFDPRHLERLAIEPLDAARLYDARGEVRAVRVEPPLLAYVTALVRRTRDWPAIALGASPRAAVAVLSLAKATAAMEDRDYMVPDDVKGAMPAALRHRLVLRPEAEIEGVGVEQVIDDVLGSVEAPR